MELVKKNVVSIVCGVIVLLAVAALFWPISGYYEELQAKADERKGVYSSMKSILEKQRKQPVLDLKGEAKELNQFPTQLVIDAATKVTEKVKAEAVAMLEKAVQMNQHALLVPNSLPSGSASTAIQFRSRYTRLMMDFVNPDKAERDKSLPVILMKAGLPPTEQQIQQERLKKEKEIRQKTAFGGANNQVLNQPQIEAELSSELPKVAQRLKEEAANGCKVYVDPQALDPYPPLAQAPPGQTPEPSAIFNAQVGLWIHQDVAQAIASANEKAATVVESPVKHLVKIDLPDEPFRALQPGQETMAIPAPNVDPSQQLPKNFALSPTGRISNGVYDVVLFSVKLNVDASQIQRVLQEFSRNKFVTVTNCSISTIDKGLMEASGYFYGENPVVQLDLQCEALLLRKWTEPLMPLRVKQALGLAAAAPGGGVPTGF